ncbi:MAG TPA: phosphatase PAP2 family protein [Terrimicrobiaceae bacterium]
METKKDVAAEKAERALKKGFAEIKTPSEAAEVVEKIESTGSDIEEKDIPDLSSSDPTAEAKVLEETADTTAPKDRAAAVLTEAAFQVASAPAESREALDEAVAKASGESSESAAKESPAVERGRSLLRKELLGRLKPFDAVDAALFIQINHLPHPKVLDRFITGFSLMMTGGHAWLLVIIAQALRKRQSPLSTALIVLPPLYLATFTVEVPIKKYFRRRRPFISIVRAIVVGRKPGSYSFPSGHSAAAFAGAVLLGACYPNGRWFHRLIALMVAFSRVYLGAHYPGDVLSGGLAGAAFAKAYRALLKFLFGK